MDTNLTQYGARLITTDGRATVEMRDPNDNARRRHQYRLALDGSLERRTLTAAGTPYADTGSPWEPYSATDLTALRAQRGRYHPILDSLGL